MRIVVNLTRCQGYAQCAFLAPDVFRMRGDEALMYDPQPDEAQRERVLRAAAACPVQRPSGSTASTTGRPPRRPGWRHPQWRRGRRSRSRSRGRLDGPRRTRHPRPVPGLRNAAIEALRRHGRIVIVGASLAGLAAAATLRREGFTGAGSP
jgi:ferredoxin